VDAHVVERILHLGEEQERVGREQLASHARPVLVIGSPRSLVPVAMRLKLLAAIVFSLGAALGYLQLVVS
jgi:hypothetical protein